METRSRSSSVIIIGLLALILAATVYPIVQDHLNKEEAQQRRATMVQVLAVQQSIVEELLSEYQAAAYDNPGVDRIAEQQLIATEHQLMALQVLMQQNILILELLSEHW